MERILNWIFKVVIPPAFIGGGARLVLSARDGSHEWILWAVLLLIDLVCYWKYMEVK